MIQSSEVIAYSAHIVARPGEKIKDTSNFKSTDKNHILGGACILFGSQRIFALCLMLSDELMEIEYQPDGLL